VVVLSETSADKKSVAAQGLATLDALAGDGGGFWGRYAASIFPQPEQLTVPFCLPHELLEQLQHRGIVDGALAQKARLAELFPGLSGPIADGALGLPGPQVSGCLPVGRGSYAWLPSRGLSFLICRPQKDSYVLFIPGAVRRGAPSIHLL
jgi:hypothetical protein